MSNGASQAFPMPEQVDPRTDQLISYTEFGLTKLEYFAGLAMQGHLVNYIEDPASVARHSVDYARALIAELEKQA